MTRVEMHIDDSTPQSDRLSSVLSPPSRWLRLFGSLPKSLLPKLPRWIRFGTWKATVLCGLGVTLFALIINVVVLVWASKKPSDSITSNPMLYQGSCSRTQTMSTWLNIGINIISTLLLACSNHTIQYISAPTRDIINKVHAEGRWLDIGISSFSNWKAMGRWSKLVCIVIAVTTLPFNLL